MRPRSAPTKRATKSDAGFGEDLVRRPELGELAADLHDRDKVAHLDRLVDVVGDEQDRLGEIRLEAQELVLESLPDDRVHGPEGLVHEHHGRVRGERAGHADSLALSARELRGEAVPMNGRIEADDGDELVDAFAATVLIPAQKTRDRGDVLADGLVREQPDLLDDVADGSAQIRDLAPGDVLAPDQDPTARRLDQPVDHLETRGLAAARRPDEDTDLARGDFERQILNRTRNARSGVSVLLGDVVKRDGGAWARSSDRRCHGRSRVLTTRRATLSSTPGPPAASLRR